VHVFSDGDGDTKRQGVRGVAGVAEQDISADRAGRNAEHNAFGAAEGDGNGGVSDEGCGIFEIAWREAGAEYLDLSARHGGAGMELGEPGGAVGGRRVRHGVKEQGY
jgi:hypothetical protein